MSNTENNKITLNEGSKEFSTLRDEWISRAKDIKDEHELLEFFDELYNRYEHDYGTVVQAGGALAIAISNLWADKEGLTGFQMSCLMWVFIRNLIFPFNTCGLSICDYDNLLYPQYEYHFNSISKETWESLQAEARKNLEEAKEDIVSYPVLAHWKSIVDGNVPFGLRVREE